MVMPSMAPGIPSLPCNPFFKVFGILKGLANFAAGEFAPSEARRFPKGLTGLPVGCQEARSPNYKFSICKFV